MLPLWLKLDLCDGTVLEKTTGCRSHVAALERNPTGQSRSSKIFLADCSNAVKIVRDVLRPIGRKNNEVQPLRFGHRLWEVWRNNIHKCRASHESVITDSPSSRCYLVSVERCLEYELTRVKAARRHGDGGEVEFVESPVVVRVAKLLDVAVAESSYRHGNPRQSPKAWNHR